MKTNGKKKSLSYQNLNLDFQLPFSRPPPPILPLEPIFIPQPTFSCLFPLNFSYACSENSFYSFPFHLSALFQTACQQTLSAAQLDEISNYCPDFALGFYEIFIGSENLGLVVENNPQLAFQIIKNISPLHKTKAEILNTLLSLPISLPCMEILHQLIFSQQISPQYFQKFSLHCFQICQHTEDPFLKNRSIKIVCLFMKKLIQTLKNPRFLNLISADLEMFCVQFSHFKHVSMLYLFLKQFEHSAALEQQTPTAAPTAAHPNSPTT